MATPIAQTMLAELNKKHAAELADANKKLQIAAAYDAHVSALPAIDAPLPSPWFVHAHNYKHTESSGCLSYKDVTPEECLQLFAYFPALPMARYRSSGRNESGIRNESRVPEYADSVTPIDAHSLRLSRYSSHSTQTKVEWHTCMADGLIVELSVELKAIHGITPEITGRVVYYNDHRTINRIENQELRFPLGKPNGLQTTRHASGSPSNWSNFSAYSPRGYGAISAYVQAMADELARRGLHSWQAYMADKTAGTLIDDAPTASSTLKAGTDAQTDALHSVAARRDSALARKHWQAYCKDSTPADWPVAPNSAYFDHYSWACKYLQSVGLYIDSAHMINGKPYKYGSAWI